MKFELMLMDAIAEGEARGEAKLAKSFASLVKDSKLTLSEAVERSGLSEEDFKKYLES